MHPRVHAGSVIHIPSCHKCSWPQDLLLPEEGQGFVTHRVPLRDVEEEDLAPHLPGEGAMPGKRSSRESTLHGERCGVLCPNLACSPEPCYQPSLALSQMRPPSSTRGWPRAAACWCTATRARAAAAAW